MIDPKPTEHAAQSASSSDVSFFPPSEPTVPASVQDPAGFARVTPPPRSLGERLDREARRLSAQVRDLEAQLQAARDELEAARLDGALALPGLVRREARRLGVDLRQSARDLYGALLLDRAHSVSMHSLDLLLVDQVRNSLARVEAGEITAEKALETISGALGHRDDEMVRRVAEAEAVHPGPPASACSECGQARGANPDDCSPCAGSGAARLGAEQ